MKPGHRQRSNRVATAPQPQQSLVLVGALLVVIGVGLGFESDRLARMVEVNMLVFAGAAVGMVIGGILLLVAGQIGSDPGSATVSLVGGGALGVMVVAALHAFTASHQAQIGELRAMLAAPKPTLTEELSEWRSFATSGRSRWVRKDATAHFDYLQSLAQFYGDRVALVVPDQGGWTEAFPLIVSCSGWPCDPVTKTVAKAFDELAGHPIRLTDEYEIKGIKSRPYASVEVIEMLDHDYWYSLQSDRPVTFGRGNDGEFVAMPKEAAHPVKVSVMLGMPYGIDRMLTVEVDSPDHVQFSSGNQQNQVSIATVPIIERDVAKMMRRPETRQAIKRSVQALRERLGEPAGKPGSGQP